LKNFNADDFRQHRAQALGRPAPPLSLTIGVKRISGVVASPPDGIKAFSVSLSAEAFLFPLMRDASQSKNAMERTFPAQPRTGLVIAFCPSFF